MELGKREIVSKHDARRAVKAISDTLKQIGPSTFVNFTRPNKGLIILPPFAPDDFQALAKRTVLLY